MTTWAARGPRDPCWPGRTACEVTVHDAFTPAGAPPGAQTGIAAVTVGAGARWLEAYRAVTARGRYRGTGQRAPAGPARPPITVSSADRLRCSPRPSAAAIAGPFIDESVTGTRSTNQAPSANRPARSAMSLRASRVWPTPPGPTAVTRRCAQSASIRAARSSTRPTNDVNGASRRASPAVAAAEPEPVAIARRLRRLAATAARARRSSTCSFRSSDETWLSTRADRDKQPGSDLGIRQMLFKRGQHLSLTRRHAPLARHPLCRPHPDCARSPPPAESRTRALQDTLACLASSHRLAPRRKRPIVCVSDRGGFMESGFVHRSRS